MKWPGSKASHDLLRCGGSLGRPEGSRTWLLEQAHPLPTDLGLHTEEASSLATCPEKTGVERKELPSTFFSLISHGGSG